MSSNPNFEQDSRAVYKALTRMSNDFALRQAGYQFWHSRFSATQADPVSLANELADYLGLDSDQKRSFLIALHASSGQAVNDLPAVPASLLMAPPSANNAAAANDPSENGFVQAESSHWVITNNFLKGLATLIKKSGPDQLLELQEIILEDEYEVKTAHLHSMFKQWASSGFSQLNLDRNISQKECAEAAHFLYLVSCEVLGPPQADVALNRVIRSLSDLPEALSFNPKNLL